MRKPMACTLIMMLAMTLPTAQGHASPDPLEVEVHLVDDDIDDSYGSYDGFDIQDLYVREAYFPGTGSGLVFRVFLYGGFAEPSVASKMILEVDVTAAGTVHTISTDSLDGETWSGSAVVEQEMEDEDGQMQGYLQLFVSYETLGVQIGDSVGPFEARTYADADLRDIAPGGRPVPGTMGQVIAPADDASLKESLQLGGPIGYTTSTVTATDNEVKVSVKNEIAVIGQHITMAVDAPAGWTIDPETLAPAIVEPGQNPSFLFQATATIDAAPATITVVSDLGGLETFQLAASSVTPSPTIAPVDPSGEESEGDGKGTPFPVAVSALSLLGLAAIRRRN